MNAMIRYGHQLTVFRMLISYALFLANRRIDRPSWTAVWEPALAQVHDESVRTQLSRFHDRAANIAAKALDYAFTSAVAWNALGRSGPGCARRCNSVRQALKAAAKKVLAGPLDQRRIEDGVFAA